MTVYSYEIVAGWNGTVANVEGLTVASATGLDTLMPIFDTDTHFFVRAIGQYDVPYQFTAGGVTQNGYATVRWTFPIITTLAVEHLITTYAQGSSQGGKVTVGTRLHTETYDEYNAYLYVPYPNVHPVEIRPSMWAYLEGVVHGELRLVEAT